MPRKTKIENEENKVEKIEQEAPEVETSVQIPDTPAKAEYRRMIEAYRLQNPVKYEQKKAEFERNLKGDIRIETDKMNKRKTFVFSNLPPKE